MAKDQIVDALLSIRKMPVLAAELYLQLFMDDLYIIHSTAMNMLKRKRINAHEAVELILIKVSRI